MEKIFKPGQRVMVYDYSLFKNDKDTPCLQLTLPATVVCWYGKQIKYYPINDFSLGPYESLVDVIFDHRPNQVSHGHFGDGVETVESLFDKELSKKFRPEYLPNLRAKALAAIGV